MNSDQSSLTSVNPNNPTQSSFNQSSPDLSGGQFGVNNPSIPTSSSASDSTIMQTPESVSQGIAATATQQNADATRSEANSTQTLANKPPVTVNVSGGGGGGGGGFGSFLGPIGSLLGGLLFAQGGIVQGYAEGGKVGDADNKSLALGYLVGALHQRDYGGTPDTLSNAAMTIKKLVEPQGFASGGEIAGSGENSTDLAQAALMHALGVNSSGSTVSEDQVGGQQQSNTQMTPQLANATTAANAGQTGGQPIPQSQQQTDQVTPTTQMAPDQPIATPKVQGFMQGGYRYADGGQGMMPPGQSPQGGPPPLKAGQMFQGDGSVKGPGGPQDDAIPAKLSNGEFVFSAPAVSFFGVDKLVKMNDQGKQGFMQALGQVEQNQQQAPQGQPQGPPGQPPQGAPPMPAQNSMPPAGPSQQQPMMQAKGGISIRNKGRGYFGL